MDAPATDTFDQSAQRTENATVFGVILAISFCHLLNDMMQSLLPAIYPNLKAEFGLTFGQVGLVTLAYQITASLLQPLVGLYADKRRWRCLAALCSPSPAFRFCRSPIAMPYCSLEPVSWASARRCFIRSLRAWPGWRREDATGWRNPCSRWAATRGRRSGPWRPRSWWFVGGNRASPPSR